MTWFWVLLSKFFDRLNGIRAKERQIYLTKAPKAFGEMSKEEREIFIRGMVDRILPKLTSEEYISGGKSEVAMSNVKKSRFMFDLPVFSDWLFYLFLFFLFANWSGSFLRVQELGGVNTSIFSLVSGSIDATFGLLISWVMVAPFYWMRRLIRKSKNSSQP
jgi:hypothetical protein